MDKLIESIQRDLAARANPEFRTKVQRLSKEPVNLLGVPTPMVRQISALYWASIREREKEDIFQLCEGLWGSGIAEQGTIALDWAYRLRRSYLASDLKRFLGWLDRYIKHWGSCDDLCTRALGAFFYKFPEMLFETVGWTTSRNRWLRRASAVALIYSVRRKNCLDTVFEVADRLLEDDDDLVQKGYGWMLKEASKPRPGVKGSLAKVFQFVMERKDRMPRIALRYAIEKMPPSWKKRAMKRG